MFKVNKYSFVLIFALSVFKLTASVFHPVYYKYGTNEGLSSSETYDVIQDKHGRIWVATDRGVSCFNGYKWISYTTSEGLTDNTVFKIYEDYSGKIWFVPISNKICYYENGKINPYRYAQKIAEKYKGVTRSFYIDRNNTIYMGIMNDGLVSIDKNGSIKEISPNNNVNRDYFVTEKDNQCLYAIKSYNFNSNKGAVFSTSHGKAITLAVDYIKKSSHLQIIGLKRKNKSQIVYCTGNSIEVIDDSLRCYATKDEILSLFEDKDSCLWVSYRHGEVRKYSKNKGLTDSGYRSYFPNEIISCIYQDKSNGFWFTTLTKGVFYVPTFGIEYAEYDSKSSFSAMTVDEKNHKVILGLENGLLISCENNGNIKILNTDNHDPSNYIYSLLAWEDGLFIGGRTQVMILSDNKYRLINENVYARHLLQAGEQIYGFTNRTLFSVNLKTGVVEKKMEKIFVVSYCIKMLKIRCGLAIIPVCIFFRIH